MVRFHRASATSSFRQLGAGGDGSLGLTPGVYGTHRRGLWHVHQRRSSMAAPEITRSHFRLPVVLLPSLLAVLLAAPAPAATCFPFYRPRPGRRPVQRPRARLGAQGRLPQRHHQRGRGHCPEGPGSSVWLSYRTGLGCRDDDADIPARAGMSAVAHVPSGDGAPTRVDDRVGVLRHRSCSLIGQWRIS